MSIIDKKSISGALKEAMAREDLNTRAVAKALNLNPCYISMCQNPNSWDSMGKAPWVRLEEWAVTRDKISEFKIPEGEEIWKPKEKAFTAADVKKAEKSFREEMDAHDKRVVERNHRPEVDVPFTSANTELRGVNGIIAELKSININLNEENARLRSILEKNNVVTPASVTQKLSLDIEINLVINGKKITL
jgi:hypothetical protein